MSSVNSDSAGRVGVYVRQSAARASGSEASPATQRDAGREEARRRGAASVEMYEDIGISAFRDVERPDFDRMISDCRAGRLNMIIVYYVSRFSRKEVTDAIPLVTELLQLGVTIVSVTEGTFQQGNVMDLIHLIMRLDAAHAESKNKSTAVRAAQQKAREYGGYVGGKAPYGFRLKPETITMSDGRPLVIQHLEIEPEEAAVIRDVRDRIVNHMTTVYAPGSTRRHPGSLSGIAADFNETGVPTRGRRTGTRTANSAWDQITLAQILRNPAIAGYAATPEYYVTSAGRVTARVARHHIKRDADGSPVVTHEAIIEPAEWWALQAWLDTRGRGKGLSRGKSLLSGIGLLYCECGRPMKSKKATGQNVRPQYQCTRARGVSANGEHPGMCTIVQAVVDDYVARRVFSLIETAEGDEDTLAILAEATRRFAREVESPDIAAERATLTGQRAETTTALDEMYDDRAAGAYRGERGRAAFRREEASLSERLEAIDKRLAELDAIASPTLPLASWLERDDPSGDPLGPGSWWARATLAERQTFLRLFVERITVTRSEGRRNRFTPVSVIQDRVTVEWVNADDADDAA